MAAATFHVLTLRGGPPSPELRAALAEVAALPPPELPGLRARHWRAERRALVGRYLFDAEAALAELREDPARDPAIARLPPVAPAVAEPIFEADLGCLDRPVFLISAPRAGSTLLYEALARARAAWTIDGESHGVLEGVPALHPARRGWASDRLDERDADPAAVAAVRAGFVAELRDRGGRRYLELPRGERPDRSGSSRRPRRTRSASRSSAPRSPTRGSPCSTAMRARTSAAWSTRGTTTGSCGSPRCPAGRAAAGARCCRRGGASSTARRCPTSPRCSGAPPTSRRSTISPRSRAIGGPASSTPSSSRRPRARSAGCATSSSSTSIPSSPALAGPLPLSSTTITAPSPIKWRSNPHLRASSLDGLGPLAGRLRHLATLAAPEPPRPEHDADPRVRFACFVDDVEPLAGEAAPAALVVHPALVVQRGASPPLPLARRARHRDRFLAEHPMLWTEDPATGALQPLWLRRDQLHLCAELAPGRPPPPSLAPAFTSRLAAAGVLARPGALARRRAEGDALVADAGHDLARDRCCRLPAILHPAQASALARYFRALVGSGGWALGDPQVARRHGWHNELVARFYHHQLAGFVGRLAGEDVKPSYCYASAYQTGAALAAHADRKQCELTMSLLIDQADDAPPWPLWFEAPGGKRSVTLSPGDAVLFRGCELPHWREAAPPGQRSTMLLFHYVPASFAGVLD